MNLHILWFLLLGVLLAGYAILDGFDLGVGILHPIARTDQERRTFIQAIGPIWDGNEVWLITFGGALFAAFPNAYATVFSGFYIAFFLLLFALVFRAVSIEFRSKITSPRWRSFWDWGFFASSLVATIIFGVGVGNAIKGLELDAQGNYIGGFFALLNPYAVGVGLLAASAFAVHGANYLNLKTPPGPLHERVKKWMGYTTGAFLVLYVVVSMVTLATVPQATANFAHFPAAYIIVAINILAVANIPRAVYKNHPVQAFVSSTVAITALVSLIGVALFPNLVTAWNNPAHSLTIYSAASSDQTLGTMGIIAAIGMPFVLAYSALIYWTFRGRVKVDEEKPGY